MTTIGQHPGNFGQQRMTEAGQQESAGYVMGGEKKDIEPPASEQNGEVLKKCVDLNTQSQTSSSRIGEC